MSIQNELREWAEETVNVYNPMAQTAGLGYYTQSVLNRETLDPDLLILGINPGAAGGCLMTGKELLLGNPCFKGKNDKEIIDIFYNNYDPQKRKKGWDIMVKTRNMLELAGKQILNDLDKFVLSNMVFFGTAKQGQIPKAINKNDCAKQTLKLIEILKPKVIVLLGKECRNLFNTVAGTNMVAITPDNAVFYCFYNNCHVISTYHTAYYRYYTYENMEKVGKIIGCALDNSSEIIDKKLLESYLFKE